MMPPESESPAAPVPGPPPSRGALIPLGNFFFKYRNALFPVVFALLLVFTRPALFAGSVSWDVVAVAAGTGIALLGQAFRVFVIGYAYIVRGGRNRKVYADDLVIAGVYAHSRNPMYVGNFLITVGLGIAYGSLWVYVAVIPFFTLVYLSIVLAEEDYLRRKFGPAYDEYCRTVPRFWPRFKGMRETFKGHAYDWRKVVAKEYGTVCGTLAGIITIILSKLWWIYGYEARKTQIMLLFTLYVPVAVLYTVARLLKKTGRLHPPSPGVDAKDSNSEHRDPGP
jgi:protein-S-isoprenylcysteine O-methyltransferase Ste14